jgi:hypothetical protein
MSGIDVLTGNPRKVLDSQMDGLLQNWNARQDNPQWRDWTGFGVSLEAANPRIVYFVGSGVAPSPDTFEPKDLLDRANSPTVVTSAKFQAITPAHRSVPFGPLRNSHPGDNIEANLNSPGVQPGGGTIGAFLVASIAPQSKWALSANHVIAFNNQYAGVAVSVPGTALSVNNPRCVPVAPGAANPVDAAIVSCVTVDAISPRIPNLPVATVAPLPRASGSTSVLKVGWASPRPVPGSLSYFAARIEVDQGSNQIFGFNPCEFANQWVIEGPNDPMRQFAAPGDSGSLVVGQLDGGNQPLGILIAVQHGGLPAPPTLLSIATPLSNVLASLADATGVALALDPDMVGSLLRSTHRGG